MHIAGGGGGYGGTDWNGYDVASMWSMLEPQETDNHWKLVSGWRKTAELASLHISRMQRYRDELAQVWPPEKNAAAAAYVQQLDYLIQHTQATYEAAVANQTAFSGATSALSQARTELKKLHDEHRANQAKLDDYHLAVAAQSDPSNTLPGVNLGPPPVDPARQEQLTHQARSVMFRLSGEISQARVALRQPPPYTPPKPRLPGGREEPVVGADGGVPIAPPPPVIPPVTTTPAPPPSGPRAPVTSPSGVTLNNASTILRTPTIGPPAHTVAPPPNTSIIGPTPPPVVGPTPGPTRAVIGPSSRSAMPTPGTPPVKALPSPPVIGQTPAATPAKVPQRVNPPGYVIGQQPTRPPVVAPPTVGQTTPSAGPSTGGRPVAPTPVANPAANGRPVTPSTPVASPTANGRPAPMHGAPPATGTNGARPTGGAAGPPVATGSAATATPNGRSGAQAPVQISASRGGARVPVNGQVGPWHGPPTQSSRRNGQAAQAEERGRPGWDPDTPWQTATGVPGLIDTPAEQKPVDPGPAIGR